MLHKNALLSLPLIFTTVIKKVKLVTCVEGDLKGSFLIANTPRCWGGR